MWLFVSGNPLYFRFRLYQHEQNARGPNVTVGFNEELMNITRRRPL